MHDLCFAVDTCMVPSCEQDSTLWLFEGLLIRRTALFGQIPSLERGVFDHGSLVELMFVFLLGYGFVMLEFCVDHGLVMFVFWVGVPVCSNYAQKVCILVYSMLTS